MTGDPGQPPGRRDRRPSLLRAVVFLAAFIGVSLAWRLPPALGGLASAGQARRSHVSRQRTVSRRYHLVDDGALPVERPLIAA